MHTLVQLISKDGGKTWNKRSEITRREPPTGTVMNWEVKPNVHNEKFGKVPLILSTSRNGFFSFCFHIHFQGDVARIPNEILAYIFSFTTSLDKFMLTYVCKRFKEYIFSFPL